MNMHEYTNEDMNKNGKQTSWRMEPGQKEREQSAKQSLRAPFSRLALFPPLL